MEISKLQHHQHKNEMLMLSKLFHPRQLRNRVNINEHKTEPYTACLFSCPPLYSLISHRDYINNIS